MPEAEPATTCYRLVIDGWHPATLNQLLAGRWQAARLKKVDRHIVAAYFALSRIPMAKGKRRVQFTITLAPKMRAADPDAYFKSALDAMTKCGAILDDNRQSIDLGPMLFDRGPRKRTTITLEDI